MRCRRAGLRHATHARNHRPGPASAERPQAEQATYAARPIRPPSSAYPARQQAGTKATGRVPQHPQARGHENARPGAAFFSQPGTAPPELEQHRDQLAAAEPGPPRSQRHHERVGRRLYKRIEAAATIEAEWAEHAGALRLEEL